MSYIPALHKTKISPVHTNFMELLKLNHALVRRGGNAEFGVYISQLFVQCETTEIFKIDESVTNLAVHNTAKSVKKTGREQNT